MGCCSSKDADVSAVVPEEDAEAVIKNAQLADEQVAPADDAEPQVAIKAEEATKAKKAKLAAEKKKKKAQEVAKQQAAKKAAAKQQQQEAEAEAKKAAEEAEAAAATLIQVKPLRAKSIVPLTSRAVHPLFLDAIAQMEVDNPDGSPGKVKISELYTYEVVKYFVRPYTAASGVSLIETMWDYEMGGTDYDTTDVQAVLAKYKSCTGGHFTQPGAAAVPRPYCGKVHYFLSHAWSYRFGHLKDMVKQHYENVTGSEHKYVPVYYWIDIFAVSQNFEGDFKRHPDGDFPAVIKQSKSVVFTIYPWQTPIAPTRIWCLFEALTAVDLNVSLELLLDSQFKKEKGANLSLEQRFLTSVVNVLDVCKAEATVESDRLQIMHQLNDRKGGVQAFNALMRGMLRSRMLEALLMRVITTHGSDGGKQIVDEGATFHNSQLKFKYGRITDQSLELISQALVGNKTVTSLDLAPPSQKGAISHKGADALAAALRRNSVLTELDLSYNADLGDHGVAAIAQALTPNGKGGGGAGKPGNKALTVRGGRSPAADAEAGSSALHTLRLSKVGLEDAGLDALAAMLAVNTTITSLDISHNADVSAESLADFLKVVEGNKTLKSLNLSGLDFGPSFADTSKALPEMIEGNKTLESLYLCGCHMNQRSCKRLAEAIGNSNLKMLDVANNLFSESAATELAEALTKNSALQELRLKSCEIGITEAALLRSALAKSGIQTVDLSGNRFGRDQWDGIGKSLHKLNTTVKCDSPKACSAITKIF